MEITNNARQVVPLNGTLVFNETVIPGNCTIQHRQGSGLVTLRGTTKGCCTKARFRVFFGANIALNTASPLGPVQLSIAIDGEPIQSTAMIVTPASSAEAYGNVASSVFIEVPSCCCVTVSVKNSGGAVLSAQNANLIVERVA